MSSGYLHRWRALTGDYFWLIAAGRELPAEERDEFITEAEKFVREAIKALAELELAEFEQLWLEHRAEDEA